MGAAHWTEAEDRKLRRMLREGKTDEQIGAALGRSAMGVKFRRNAALGLHRRGSSNGATANTRHRAAWSEEDVKQLRRMVAAGKSYAEIAKRLKRSTSAVSKHAKDLGIGPRQTTEGIGARHRGSQPQAEAEWSVCIEGPGTSVRITTDGETAHALLGLIMDGGA